MIKMLSENEYECPVASLLLFTNLLQDFMDEEDSMCISQIDEDTALITLLPRLEH